MKNFKQYFCASILCRNFAQKLFEFGFNGFSLDQWDEFVSGQPRDARLSTPYPPPGPRENPVLTKGFSGGREGGQKFGERPACRARNVGELPHCVR